MKPTDTLADTLGQIIFRLETNFDTCARRLSPGVVTEPHAAILRDIERLKEMKAAIFGLPTLSRQQLNIIANCVVTDSSGEARAAKTELAIRLYPGEEARIREAIINHPIIKRWDEYVKTAPEAQANFLLPETTVCSLADGWWIPHPGTLVAIPCASFKEAMDKWFEGFNIPFLVANGKREDFDVACQRVKEHIRSP